MNHTINIIHHILVPKADHFVALRFQIVRSFYIVLRSIPEVTLPGTCTRGKCAPRFAQHSAGERRWANSVQFGIGATATLPGTCTRGRCAPGASAGERTRSEAEW